MAKQLFCKIPKGKKTISIEIFLEGNFLQEHITKVCYNKKVNVFELYHNDFLFKVVRNKHNLSHINKGDSCTFDLECIRGITEEDLFRKKRYNKRIFNKIHHINSFLNYISIYYFNNDNVDYTTEINDIMRQLVFYTDSLTKDIQENPLTLKEKITKILEKDIIIPDPVSIEQFTKFYYAIANAVREEE